MLYKFVLMALLIGIHPLEGGWLERKAEGWAWYEEEEKEVKSQLEEESTMSAISQLENIKKELEVHLAEAILKPTHENITAYMEMQKFWINQSAVFSGEWQKILLTRPDLDPTATSFATTYYGRLLQKSLEEENKTKSIHKISKEYGLVFFYEGEKKESQAFSKVVKALNQKYQWPVVGIAMDNISLEDFPNEHKTELATKFELKFILL